MRVRNRKKIEGEVSSGIIFTNFCSDSQLCYKLLLVGYLITYPLLVISHGTMFIYGDELSIMSCFRNKMTDEKY